MVRTLTLEYLKTFGNLLNKNTEYQKFKLTEDFLFKVKDGEAFVLSMAEGKVKDVRNATAKDEPSFIYEADKETWSQLLEGTLDPFIAFNFAKLNAFVKGAMWQNFFIPFWRIIYLLSMAP